MKIKRSIDLDYGHVLPDYCGFCNQVHGHRAKVVASFIGDVNVLVGDASNGMVVDFSVCKKIMVNKISNVLDHGFALWRYDHKDIIIKSPAVPPDTSSGMFVSMYDFILSRNDRVLLCDLPPTAEYLSWWAYGEIAAGLEEFFHKDIICGEVEWHETPNNIAVCTMSDYFKLKGTLNGEGSK